MWGYSKSLRLFHVKSLSLYSAELECFHCFSFCRRGALILEELGLLQLHGAGTVQLQPRLSLTHFWNSFAQDGVYQEVGFTALGVGFAGSQLL